MSEDILIQCGSPTLAGLKTGNLFSVAYSSRQQLLSDIRKLNHTLVPRGLCLLPMKLMRKRAVCYLFRPALLERDLKNGDARSILDQAGYRRGTMGQCLGELIGRMRSGNEFPHEIGLFLSYPPEDVQGFIENRASNCKCVGTWKVYGNEEEARKTFRRYRHCKEVYDRCWRCGTSFERLIVR